MNTSHDDHPDPTVNPLVSEMLAAGKDQTTSIEGFVGKVEAGMVRIYANLGLNHYIEVPEAALVRVVEARDPKGPAVLILRRDVPITYVQTHHRAGISVSQSITTSIDALSAIDIGDVKAAHDCGCGPVPAHAVARQSGGGPEVSICTWSCQERALQCLARSGPLTSLWCYLNYGLCRVGCEIPPVIYV